VRSLVVLALLSTSLLAGLSEADELRENVDLITETADKLCYTVQQEGSQSQVKISGDIDAELSKFLKKLADIGGKVAVEYSKEDYIGLARDQLGQALKNSADCKKDVFDKLYTLYLKPQTSDSKKKISDIVNLMNEGRAISDDFISKKDVDNFVQNYTAWKNRAYARLTQQLDDGYAAQFVNAPQQGGALVGMPIAGMGYWQRLQGQIEMLSGIITQLRRGG
jgi:hypothetical protein